MTLGEACYQLHEAGLCWYEVEHRTPLDLDVHMVRVRWVKNGVLGTVSINYFADPDSAETAESAFGRAVAAVLAATNGD